ncbi:MAG: FkbM family methyltransferase [Clostridia bacterium]|nr:FkbM family methyltransferase [Clostridia bacterium]
MTTECLWDRLARRERPIWLYGTGNGADKILDVLEARGIPVDGVFASDGFVRSRTFRGMPVRSYSDVRALTGDDMTVLLAFGSAREDVLAFVRMLDDRHDLLIPEVPLYGGDLFDGSYYASHRSDLAEVRALLSDDRSRSLFDAAVAFRLTGRLAWLSDTEPMETSVRDLFSDQTIRTVVDGGAFRGDSAEVFVRILHPETVFAAEPDPASFRKLEAYARTETRTKILPIHSALWDDAGSIPYAASGSRGSGEEGHGRRAKETEVRTTTVDMIVKEIPLDFLKLDVEGAEARALHGAENSIRRDEPNLAVSLYHRTDDLFALPRLVHALLPAHRLYLRRVPCLPMWDLTLYAVRA